MPQFELGKNTTRNLESILQSGKKESKILVDAVKAFINFTPMDFCILSSGGYRTALQQNGYFKSGNSKCDGYQHLSEHQSGLAVDLVPWVNGKKSYDKKDCFYLAGAFVAFCNARGLNVTSGADWNRDGNLKDGWDPVHMQIKEG